MNKNRFDYLCKAKQEQGSLTNSGRKVVYNVHTLYSNESITFSGIHIP